MSTSEAEPNTPDEAAQPENPTPPPNTEDQPPPNTEDTPATPEPTPAENAGNTENTEEA